MQNLTFLASAKNFTCITQVIFCLHTVFSKSFRIYFPVGTVTGICDLYDISGIQSADLIRIIICHLASKSKNIRLLP